MAFIYCEILYLTDTIKVFLLEQQVMMNDASCYIYAHHCTLETGYVD